jgi:hypothetical protein
MAKVKNDWFSVGSLSLYFLVLIVITAVWFLGGWYLKVNYYDIDKPNAGQFGDTFGVMNSLFAGFAFAGLTYTILLQRKELRDTRAEFEQQNETLKKQRFETTFFNLLSIHNSLVDKIEYRDDLAVALGSTTVKAKGRSVFDFIFDTIDDQNLNIDLFNTEKSSSVEQLKNNYRDLFKGERKQTLELYFQSLSALVSFVIKSDLLICQDQDKEFTDRTFYSSILTATQSLNERTVIFYHIGLGRISAIVNDPVEMMQQFEKYTHTYWNTNKQYIRGNISHVLLFDRTIYAKGVV